MARRPKLWLASVVPLVVAIGGTAIAVRSLDEGGDPAPRPPVRAKADTDRVQAPKQRPVRFTVAASGDLLIHSPVFQRALAYGNGRRYDFRPLFRKIAPYVRGADLALCHVETPMTPAAPRGYPIFSTPPSLAFAISRTGWDACSTASNHALDGGESGVASTLGALDRARVRHAGSYRTARGARRPLIVRVRGVKVALLAYTQTTNGRPLPRPWSIKLARPRRILADARRARARGARVVLVNIHWGPPEYTSRPAPRQMRLARRLARSRRITAVIGQGPHVVWPIRWLSGKPVVFSEGNLVSNQTAACCSARAQDGLIALLRVVVERGHARVARVAYVPTWVRHPDYTVLTASRGTPSYRRTVAVAGRGPRVRPLPAR